MGATAGAASTAGGSPRARAQRRLFSLFLAHSAVAAALVLVVCLTRRHAACAPETRAAAGAPAPAVPTSAAAQQLLQHAARTSHALAALGAQLAGVQQRLDAAAAAPPASPAPPGARVSDSELQHIGRQSAVCDRGGAAGLALNVSAQLVSPLVVVAHARPGYLARTLLALHKSWSRDAANAAKFPLFISVDGDDQRTLLLAAALHEAAGVQVIRRVREAPPRSADREISQHYKLLLQLFFTCLGAPRLAFLEEDLQVAPDFLSLFEATAPLLERDPSILCVSAWNDHGQAGRASDATALYRTDVMPGLGWMVSAAVGRELAAQWPSTNWDDWLRLPGVRKGRSCIFPEVPRTHTFGKVGAHGGEHYEAHLRHMLLSSAEVPWTSMDLSYLRAASYAARMDAWLAAAAPFNGSAEALGEACAVGQPDDPPGSQDFKVAYAGTSGYTALATRLAPMLADVREGSPRASFRGTVIVRCRGRRVFLTLGGGGRQAAAPSSRAAQAQIK